MPHPFRRDTRTDMPPRATLEDTGWIRPLLVTAALVATALLALLLGSGPARAQSAPGAILIWPVDPAIDADSRAAALWLENPGTAPIALQVRIYAWTQEDGKNLYAAQDAVLGTPPIVRIAPGERQLVRLTRMSTPAAGTETPYRIVIDELPAPAPAPTGGDPGDRATREEAAPGAAIAFRMRYSLPLFSYGPGAARPAPPVPEQPGRASHVATAGAPSPAPELRWRLVGNDAGAMLEIANSGALHARLTAVGFSGAPPAPGEPGAYDLSPGLLGYVLPGKTMRFPLTRSMPAGWALHAAVNGGPPVPIARAD
jgi:fimbrial chaperone protein